MELLRQILDILGAIALQIGCIMSVIYMFDGSRRLFKHGKSKEAKNTLIIGIAFSVFMIIYSAFSFYFIKDITNTIDNSFFEEKASQSEGFASAYFSESGILSVFKDSDGNEVTYCPTQDQLNHRYYMASSDCKIEYAMSRAIDNIISWLITIIVSILFGWVASRTDFGKDIKLFNSNN